MKFSSRFWKIFLLEAFLYSLALALGIITALRLKGILEIQKIEIPSVSFGQFIGNFLLATLFIFLLIKFLKSWKEKRIIFKIFFVFAVLFGGLLFLEVWIREPTPLILIVFLIFWWFKKPSVLIQDILMIFGIVGAGSVLGLSLRPEMAVLILIIFSIYDFIAVYKTKHMVEMAKEMIESKAILALAIPPNISGFKETLERIQPGGDFLILGGGDIVFPLLFSVSLISESILKSITVALFSLIGLFSGFYVFTHQKVRQPIPALPPIVLFSIIGFFITKFLK